jgi:hypothetical protein
MEKMHCCSHKEQYLHLNPGSSSSTLAEKQTTVHLLQEQCNDDDDKNKSILEDTRFS